MRELSEFRLQVYPPAVLSGGGNIALTLYLPPADLSVACGIYFGPSNPGKS